MKIKSHECNSHKNAEAKPEFGLDWEHNSKDAIKMRVAVFVFL